MLRLEEKMYLRLAEKEKKKKRLAMQLLSSTPDELWVADEIDR